MVAALIPCGCMWPQVDFKVEKAAANDHSGHEH